MEGSAKNFIEHLVERFVGSLLEIDMHNADTLNLDVLLDCEGLREVDPGLGTQELQSVISRHTDCGKNVLVCPGFDLRW